jgi:hypothetical protein
MNGRPAFRKTFKTEADRRTLGQNGDSTIDMLSPSPPNSCDTPRVPHPDCGGELIRRSPRRRW